MLKNFGVGGVGGGGALLVAILPEKEIYAWHTNINQNTVDEKVKCS